MWTRPEVTLLLSGMNDEKHLAENVRIAGEARPGSLSPRELALIDLARDAFRAAMKVGAFLDRCNKGAAAPSEST